MWIYDSFCRIMCESTFIREILCSMIYIINLWCYKKEEERRDSRLVVWKMHLRAIKIRLSKRNCIWMLLYLCIAPIRCHSNLLQSKWWNLSAAFVNWCLLWQRWKMFWMFDRYLCCRKRSMSILKWHPIWQK